MGELLGIARLNPGGQGRRVQALSAEAMEIVRTKDSGTLQYDIYLNDDESECMVIERYRDSDALIEHGENLGDLSGAICDGLSGSRGGARRAERGPQAGLASSPVQLFAPYQSM